MFHVDTIFLFPLYQRCESSFISDASCKPDAAGFSERRENRKRKEVSPLPAISPSLVRVWTLHLKELRWEGWKVAPSKGRERRNVSGGEKGVREEKKSEEERERENVDLDENNSSNWPYLLHVQVKKCSLAAEGILQNGQLVEQVVAFSTVPSSDPRVCSMILAPSNSESVPII